MHKLIHILATFTLLGSSIARGEATYAKIRQAEKIAIALTGNPLTPEMRTKVVKEQITLDALADQLSKGDEFIEHFAQYWSRVIGMQSPIDLYDQGGLGIGRNWLGLGDDNKGNFTLDYVKRFADEHSKDAIELMITRCDDMPLITWWNSANHANGPLKTAVEQKISPGGEAIPAAVQPHWQRLYDIARATSANCEDKTTIEIQPWWDPEKVTIHSKYINVLKYKTTQGVIDHCGGVTLPNCSLGYDRSGDRFMDEVDRDVSMEPGYIISHTVAEDKPFTDVLTTQSTIMTGTFGYFMATLGKSFWSLWPGGGIADLKHPIFEKPQVLDRKHYWIKRNELHAGILTTQGYQVITNGPRAKANRTYESFLCKKFTVPDGAQADPKDANPDLAQRAYCSYCHKSLEPMAAFFNNWPKTGDVRYRYNSDKSIVSKGRFNGMEGTGAAAFGKIVSESEGFDECSIRRAFEYLHGRKMSSVELENKLPSYLTDFRAAQKNLRTIMKAMVLAPEFLTPKAGGL